jgi:hypothetical protein
MSMDAHVTSGCVAMLLALSLAPAAAAAQQALDTGSTARAQDRPLALRVAAGPRLDASGGGGLLEGRSVQAGIEWRPRGWRPVLRLELSAAGDRWSLGAPLLITNQTLLPSACEQACTTTLRQRQFGLALDATLAFRAWRLRPYVASGAGLYRRVEQLERSWRCAPDASGTACTIVPAPVERVATGRSLLAGLHAAGGLGVRLGRAELFGELRAQAMLDQGRSPGNVRYPALVGVRF